MWAAAKARIAQWDRRAQDPAHVQTQTLLSHCATAAATEFGRAHRLGEVRSYKDFAARVPVRSYKDFEPYLTRMRKGERDVLWPGLIRYYGQSSGTSNTAAMHKFLPISHEQIRWQQRASFDLVARYITLTNDLFYTNGHTLALFPPAVVKPDGPVGITSNPGLMSLHVPKAGQLLLLPRSPLREMEDYDKKLDAIAEAYLDYNIVAMTGTTCWFSIFFDRLLAAAHKQGRKVDTVSQIWPNLRVLFGGGVHAKPYRRIIMDRIGDRPGRPPGQPAVLIDNYNATEGGIFASTERLDDSDDAGMLMLPDRGVFFEFVPRGEHGQSGATRVPLWEVEPGRDYSVVLTTSSGLFAYEIGDFIRFTSVFPHRMQFAGRASGVLSVTQELTTNLELEQAVAQASAQHPCTIVDFATSSEVGIDGTAKGRYVFFIEFDRDPKNLAEFEAAVDRELCQLNRVYREHRAKNVAILPPTVTPLARGATRKFMEALGHTSVQHKFPRIVDERRRDVLRTFIRDF
jgi:hypothetical protein